MTPRENEELVPIQPVLMNMYQSDTYRKDLSWQYFDDELRVQEKKQVKDQQSYIRFCSLSNNSKLQLGAPAQTTVFHGKLYDGFIKIKSNLRSLETS